MTIQEEVDEYIETHPYLKKATSAQERLTLWLYHQPERNVIARFLADSDYERDTFIRESKCQRCGHGEGCLSSYCCMNTAENCIRDEKESRR